MGLGVGAIIEATIEGECLNQKILNVFHYVVTTASTTPLVSDEMAHFLTRWPVEGVGSFRADWLALMPDNYTWQFANAQPVAPDRYVKFKVGVGAVGTGDPTPTTNTSAAITLQTDFGGRMYVGGKRILTNPNEAIDGNWSAGRLALLNTFCDDILASVTATTGGGVYAPCLYHRNATPASYNLLRRAFPQSSARVMRRRTLGLGI